MIYILYGALGTVCVILLFGFGVLAGWKGHDAWIAHARKKAEGEPDEEERRRLIAQQRAFEVMLNYNADIAYGGDRD